MLVQVLAGTNPKKEAPRHHSCHGSGSLGDNSGVGANKRAGDARAKLKPLGGMGDCADNTPDERGLALLIDPGMEMVRDEGVAKANFLGAAGVLNERVRRMLFT